MTVDVSKTMRLAKVMSQTVAVCSLAMFAGCVLMVALTFVPYWSSLTPQAFLDVFGRFNILIPRTLGPILLPALIGVLGSLIATWRVPRQRLLWLLAAGCFFTTLALTAL